MGRDATARLTTCFHEFTDFTAGIIPLQPVGAAREPPPEGSTCRQRMMRDIAC